MSMFDVVKKGSKERKTISVVRLSSRRRKSFFPRSEEERERSRMSGAKEGKVSAQPWMRRRRKSSLMRYII
jgi:hypothetical protein